MDAARIKGIGKKGHFNLGVDQRLDIVINLIYNHLTVRKIDIHFFIGTYLYCRDLCRLRTFFLMSVTAS